MMSAFAPDAQSGDFYAPKDNQSGVTLGLPVKVLASGAMADTCPEWTMERFNNEELTLSKSNHDVLWTASEAAIGESWRSLDDNCLFLLRSLHLLRYTILVATDLEIAAWLSCRRELRGAVATSSSNHHHNYDHDNHYRGRHDDYDHYHYHYHRVLGKLDRHRLKHRRSQDNVNHHSKSQANI